MRVLIACEFSGVVREAFRRQGVDAWSCDLLPAEDKSPFHRQQDVFQVMLEGWDMMIAHPPCTHLAVSGARHFKAKRLDGRQKEGIDFFMRLAESSIKYKCIENPVSIMSSLYRKPDQYVHPYFFGDPVSKKTCLWLTELPPLVPTNIVEPLKVRNSYGNLCDRWWMETLRFPATLRGHERSRTFSGLACAMASQWSPLCLRG